MAKLLPNRTDNDIKNKWNSMLRSNRIRKKRAEQAIHEALQKNVVASAVASAVQGHEIPVATKSEAGHGNIDPSHNHPTGVIAGSLVGAACEAPPMVLHGSDEPNCGDEGAAQFEAPESPGDRLLPNGTHSIENYVSSSSVKNFESL